MTCNCCFQLDIKKVKLTFTKNVKSLQKFENCQPMIRTPLATSFLLLIVLIFYNIFLSVINVKEDEKILQYSQYSREEGRTSLSWRPLALIDNQLTCQYLLFQESTQILNHQQLKLQYISKRKMASPPYSLYFTQLPLSFYNYSTLQTTFQENHSIFPETVNCSSSLFCSPLALSVLPHYNLLVTSVLAPETPSNSMGNDWWGTAYNSSFPSTTNLQQIKDSTMEYNQTMPAIKIEEQYCQIQSCFIQKIKEKRGKQPKIRKSDKDYLPHRSEKRQVRRRIHQNQNRNVIPNEINQIISFLQKRSKSGTIIQRLWVKYPAPEENFSINRFYVYQNILKEKVGHYSNQASLKLLSQLYEPECRIWHQSEQRYYIKLSRMLVSHFLRQDSIFIILTSKRMRSQKKLEHLRARRNIACRILELFKRG